MMMISIVLLLCLQEFIVDCLISYFECKSFRVQQYKFPRTYRKKKK